jgi:hypothetical protein
MGHLLSMPEEESHASERASQGRNCDWKADNHHPLLGIVAGRGAVKTGTT